MPWQTPYSVSDTEFIIHYFAMPTVQSTEKIKVIRSVKDRYSYNII